MIRFEKEGLFGPSIKIPCIHTELGKGGLWVMNIQKAKQIYRELGAALKKAAKLSTNKRKVASR